MKKRLRVAAVVNPVAGGDGDRVVAAMEAVSDATVEPIRTRAAGDAQDIAYKLASSQTPPDIIAAVGGDGTVCEVATGLYRARAEGAADVPPLLVGPAGTGNSTYRGLWNDELWETVAERALRGQALARTLDLARIEQNDHLVMLGSGSGLFAASLLATKGRPEKGRELLMAATLATTKTYVPYQGRVLVDGEPVHEGGVVVTIVGGFRYRGGFLNLVPESVVDDRLLDITVVTSDVDMGVFADAAFSGHVYRVPGVLTGRGKRITVERTDGQPLLFEHDGEVMPQTMPSYDITTVPAALTVLTSPTAPLPWFGKR